MDVVYVENPPTPKEPLENQVEILKVQNERQTSIIAELRAQVNGLVAQLGALNSRPDPEVSAKLNIAISVANGLRADNANLGHALKEAAETRKHQAELIKLQAECLLALKSSNAFAISVADSYRPHDD